MATFRKVHVQFWGDPFIQDLTPEQKFFYLYLLTNGQTKQCGIYEITKRQICYDTGYNTDTVTKLLQYCINTDKIKYNTDTNEIAIKNWLKYNGSDSPKVQSCINQELKSVKDTVLIEYIYGIDSVEILNRNKNKNKNKNRKEEEEEDLGDEELNNKNLLVPKMFEVFKTNLPEYPGAIDKDFKPIFSIANFLQKQLSLGGSPVGNAPQIIKEWEKICVVISNDNFYSQKTLYTISNQIQEIFQIHKNGKKNGSTTSKYSGSNAGRTIIHDKI